MRKIHIISPSSGSIGEITQDLYVGLKDHFEVTIEGQHEPLIKDILLSHFVNPAIIEDPAFKQFKHKILIQPIDGTSITEQIVNSINQYDLVITPATAGKQIMQNNGITVPIIVIPNFYKTNIFTSSITLPPIKDIPQDKIVLYHESTFHPRKGVEYLYEGYVKAFSDTEWADKVVLVCKDMPFNKVTFSRIEQLKRNTIKLQKSYKRKAQIIKISQQCEWEKLQALWQRADIYVSLAKIEGFGIPLLRMAALDKPIVVLDNHYSGYNDFLNSKNAYFIPTMRVLACEEHMYLYKKDTEWAVPKIDDVISTLRQVVSDYKNNCCKRATSQEIQNLTYDNVLKKYIEVLKNI